MAFHVGSRFARKRRPVRKSAMQGRVKTKVRHHHHRRYAGVGHRVRVHLQRVHAARPAVARHPLNKTVKRYKKPQPVHTPTPTITANAYLSMY